MIQIFDTLAEYNNYTSNDENLSSGTLYYVKEDGSGHFFTNNIEGENKIYDLGKIDNTDLSHLIQRDVTTFDIPEGITTIGRAAFNGWNTLTSVTIPSTVTSIDYNSFANTGLTSVSIPDNVTSIGGYAFKDCWYLASVNLGSSVTSIGDYAFSGCDGTTGDLILPNTLTSIGQYAFSNCRFGGILNIPDSVTVLKNNAFADCWNFTGLTIGSGVTSIPSSCFYQLKNITNVDIPNNVTEIKDNAFNGCTKLETVTMGNAVTSIKYNAFSGCTKLSSITIETTTPPTLGSNAFYNNKSGRKIFVPAESVDAYKAASGWSTYANDIEAIKL